MSTEVGVLTFGETMLALNASGPLSPGAQLTASVAGAESNVAIGLARLGHTAAWVGRVGDDEAGALVIRTLRGEGVDTRPVVDAAATGILLRRERVAGITTVDYHRRLSAGTALSAHDVLPHLTGPRPPRWLHVTGVTPALSDSARTAAVTAIDAARSAGVRVCLDVNHRSRLWSSAAASEALTPLARLADVVIASEDELPLVATGPQELLAGVTRLVAVKRGSAGATMHEAGGQVLERNAVPARAVDAVGAGDAFCAGLLSGLLDGLEPSACLDRAVLLGAFSVSTSGDWEGLPSRSELHMLGLGDGAVVR